MKKRENTFLKLDWPFKGLGKGAKKAAAGIVNVFKNDELRELSESLDRSMSKMSESLEKMRKSAMAQKRAEQKLVNIYNEITAKTRELEVIAIENRRSSYLRNSIWQNRQN